jgi:hypothetical protein
MLQSTTPDLPSNPEKSSGGGACSGRIMAMRAQKRTVIEPMYIEDADVMKVLRIIRGGLPLWSIQLIQPIKVVK